MARTPNIEEGRSPALEAQISWAFDIAIGKHPVLAVNEVGRKVEDPNDRNEILFEAGRRLLEEEEGLSHFKHGRQRFTDYELLALFDALPQNRYWGKRVEKVGEELQQKEALQEENAKLFQERGAATLEKASAMKANLVVKAGRKAIQAVRESKNDRKVIRALRKHNE